MTIIKNMSEGDLVEFLPTIGDRMSVKLFVDEQLKKMSAHAKSDKKKKLMRNLRKKLGIIRKEECEGSTESDSDTTGGKVHKYNMARKGNKHALKKNKKIELGWVHSGKQVRAGKGGGTRKLHVSRASGKQVIIQEAKKLFFPGGTSPLGKESDFDFRLSDFSHTEITNETVQELYESRKVPLLRLYLVTDIHVADCLPGPSTMSEVQGKDSGHPPSQGKDSGHPLSTSEVVIEHSSPSPPANWVDDEVLIVTDQPTDQRPDLGSFDDTMPNEGCNKHCTLTRGQVLSGLINFLQDQEFDLRLDKLLIVLKTEMGVDSGGVLRDVLSEFWETFYQKNTMGSSVKVPITTHQMQKGEWEAVAKVLIIGYKQEGYFPINLSRVFLERCISMLAHSDKEVLAEFLATLPEMDKEVCEMALKDYDTVDEDELMEIFSTYEARVLPRRETIEQILGEISHLTIFQKPAFISECWSPLLQQYLWPLLPEGGLSEVFSELSVSHKKVLQILMIQEDISRAEKVTTDALKRYIKNCSIDRLCAFLRFCTGSELMVGKKITVSITAPMSEFCLRPIAHTCGPVLEVSSSYDNYLLLREHFDRVIDSKVLRMDIM